MIILFLYYSLLNSTLIGLSLLSAPKLIKWHNYNAFSLGMSSLNTTYPLLVNWLIKFKVSDKCFLILITKFFALIYSALISYESVSFGYYNGLLLNYSNFLLTLRKIVDNHAFLFGTFCCCCCALFCWYCSLFFVDVFVGDCKRFRDGYAFCVEKSL